MKFTHQLIHGDLGVAIKIHEVKDRLKTSDFVAVLRISERYDGDEQSDSIYSARKCSIVAATQKNNIKLRNIVVSCLSGLKIDIHARIISRMSSHELLCFIRFISSNIDHHIVINTEIVFTLHVGFDSSLNASFRP